MTDSADTIKKLKREIVAVSAAAQKGHLSGAFSILDIVWVLYDKVLRIDPKHPRDPDRDIFILSKGHAAFAQYFVLAEKGFFDKKELDGYARADSPFGGHPDRNKVPGVEASTGSLGHGMPLALGMALGFKIRNKKNKVYVLIGDGESNEGTIWESALLAPYKKLDNLCCIVDYNHSTDEALPIGELEPKFESFGWQTLGIDGHDHAAIEQAVKAPHPGKPLAVIAHTKKGAGSATMEKSPAEWHHKPPNPEELARLLEELA